MTFFASRFLRVLCIVSVAACALMVAVTALPASPAIAAEITFSEAVALHDSGREGDARATSQAVEAFEALVSANAKDPLANAYLGSSYALLARDSGSITNKVRYTNRGLRYLDAAVGFGPDDFVVRLIRANVTASLPAMFGRKDQALEDMLVLDGMFSQESSPAMASHMTVIYALLSDMAPEAGDWRAKAQSARTLAGM